MIPISMFIRPVTLPHEICKWDQSFNRQVQSSVAINGQLLAGFDNFQSAKIKVAFAAKKRLAGIMWWSLDMDDFSGRFCGQGKYPLIKSTWNEYKKLSRKGPSSQPIQTGKTSSLTSRKTSGETSS